MGTRISWKNVVIKILSILLALVFLAAGGSKLTGTEMHVESFESWGYPGRFVYVTGLIEVVGALLLLFPKTRLYGGAIIICVMLGAIVTHVMASEFDRIGAPGVLLVLAAVVVWAGRGPGRG